MASIQSTVKLFDGYTPIIKSMIKVNQNIISSFSATERASGNAFDVSNLKAAQDALAQVETEFDDIERSIREAADQQQQFNQDMRNGSGAASDLSSKVKGLVAAFAGFIGVKSAVNWV